MQGTALASFGQWLKQRRKALDLTQEDLAERIGCSDVTIRKIEAGVRRPSKQVAELLVEYLKIPPDEQEAFISFARTGSLAGALLSLTPQSHAADAHSPAQPTPNNLPAPANPLIGREQETAAATDLIRQERVRLLTLTGPPGIGKTSLSIHLALGLMDDFPDGIFFVQLAPMADPGLVAGTIAQTLGVMEVGEQPLLAGLLHFLQGKQILLVLDNFEQLLGLKPNSVEGATIVAEVLSACPTVKVMVTSRAALNLRSERQFPVQPLGLPEEKGHPSPQVIAQAPAVNLFIERAQSVDPNFTLDDDNASVVAAICTRLDGLPLAIELAAARINLLSLTEIQARLDNRLGLLVGGPRDLPPRHRMLRDAIEWSYDLLDASEQALFRRLGVFVGGFTLSSVEGVCNSEGKLPMEVLEGLGSLLSKSLLQRRREHQGASGSDARFSMLETLREYALQRLTTSGEEEAIRRAHAEYFLALAEAGDVQLRGPEQTEWLERLETEHGNFRAAMSWALVQGEVELGLRLAGELGWFWELHGHYTEGRERLASALALYPPRSAQEGRTAVAARALNSAGRLAYDQGDIRNGRILLDEALSIATELDDKWLMLLTLHNLGNVAAAEGNEPLARTYYEESLVAARELGDPWGLAWALMGMGYICINNSDYEKARIYFEESLEVRRGMRDKWGIARSFTELGAVARLQGDYHKARALYEDALAIHDELGHKGWVSNSMYSLGHVALHLGEYTKAEEQFKDAIRFYTESGDTVSAASCIAGFGLVAYYRSDHRRAATLFGAAGSIHRVSNYHMEAFDRTEFESAINSLREAATNDRVIAGAWSYGEEMTLEQAIAYALQLDRES